MSASELTPHPGRPRVTITARPLWRIRLTRELPRYALYAMSLTGIAASARYLVAPPRPAALAPPPTSARPDPAAEGFAVLFARRYLTWDSSRPESSTSSLAPFAGAGVEAGAGLQLPATGRQRVEWAEVVQSRTPAAGQHVYTVAAQTDSDGLLYLSVAVDRTVTGAVSLAGYPAFVGPPDAAPAPPPPHMREVTDPALATVVERTLRNYLAGSAGELAADLTKEARVSLPTSWMALENVQRIDWSLRGRSVVALVHAHDARGVQCALTYELDVAFEQGRWEVSAVQMNPNE